MPARILHITKATGISGSERHLLSLLSGLDRSRFEPILLILEEPERPQDELAQRFEANGVTVKRLRIESNISPGLVFRLRRLMREGNYDLVHTHLVHADWYGTVAACLAGVSHCVTSRHNDNAFRRGRLFSFVDRLISRKDDQIIVISEWVGRFMREVEHLSAGKIRVIRYGLQIERLPTVPLREQIQLRSEFGISESAPLATMVARLTGQKGHVYLLEAFERVVRAIPDAQLLLIGDGELHEALEEQTRKLGLDNHVHFGGYRDKACRYVAASNVFVHPSLWEGFGLVFLEAMAYSKPVVATRVSAIPEIVVDGQTGLLVPPKTVKPLAEALTALLKDPERAGRLGRAGQERLLSEFPVEKMVKATEELYEEILRPRRRKGNREREEPGSRTRAGIDGGVP